MGDGAGDGCRSSSRLGTVGSQCGADTLESSCWGRGAGVFIHQVPCSSGCSLKGMGGCFSALLTSRDSPQPLLQFAGGGGTPAPMYYQNLTQNKQ